MEETDPEVLYIVGETSAVSPSHLADPTFPHIWLSPFKRHINRNAKRRGPMPGWLAAPDHPCGGYPGNGPALVGPRLSKKNNKLEANLKCWYCWWFRNPAEKPVEVGSLSHYLQGFMTIRGGDRRISEPSTVFLGEMTIIPKPDLGISY